MATVPTCLEFTAGDPTGVTKFVDLWGDGGGCSGGEGGTEAGGEHGWAGPGGAGDVAGRVDGEAGFFVDFAAGGGFEGFAEVDVAGEG